MAELSEEAMAAGAIGLSTGTYYPPAAAASTEEIIAAARPLARYGGRYVTHMRHEDEEIIPAMEETFRIGREAGVPPSSRQAGRRRWGAAPGSVRSDAKEGRESGDAAGAQADVAVGNGGDHGWRVAPLRVAETAAQAEAPRCSIHLSPPAFKVFFKSASSAARSSSFCCGTACTAMPRPATSWFRAASRSSNGPGCAGRSNTM